MAFTFNTTYKLTMPDFSEWKQATLGKAVKESNTWLGKFWHTVILPGLFTLKGSKDAGIAPFGRSEIWDNFKQRRGGVAIPNVGVNTKGHAGGTLRNNMLSGANISASSKKVLVTVKGTPYVRLRRGDGPDKVNELTTISKTWQAFIGREFTRRVGRFLAAEPKKKKFRKKV